MNHLFFTFTILCCTLLANAQTSEQESANSFVKEIAEQITLTQTDKEGMREITIDTPTDEGVPFDLIFKKYVEVAAEKFDNIQYVDDWRWDASNNCYYTALFTSPEMTMDNAIAIYYYTKINKIVFSFRYNND